MKLIEELKWDAKFLKENITWITATVAAIVAVSAFLVNVCSYSNYSSLSSYYGTSIEFFAYDYWYQVYTIVLITLNILVVLAWFFSFNDLVGSLFSKKSRKYIISNTVIIISSYAVLFFILKLAFGIIQSLILTALIQFLSYAIVKFVYKKFSDIDKASTATDYNPYIEAKHYFKKMPFYFIIIVFLMKVINVSEYAVKKEYKVIDTGNKSCQAIVYTTKDYYLTLDCEIEDKKLTLYKGTETKIATDNVKTSKIIFENVYLKDIKKIKRD